MAKKEFTHNEAVAMMHRHLAENLERIANYVEKWQMPPERVVVLLREMSEGLEIAAIDTDMLDSKGFKIERQTSNGEWRDNLKMPK